MLCLEWLTWFVTAEWWPAWVSVATCHWRAFILFQFKFLAGRSKVMVGCRGWHFRVLTLFGNMPRPVSFFSGIREFQRTTLSPHFGHFLAFLLDLWGPRKGYRILWLYGALGMGLYNFGVWSSLQWCLEMGMPVRHLKCGDLSNVPQVMSSKCRWPFGGHSTLQWGGDCHGSYTPASLFFKNFTEHSSGIYFFYLCLFKMCVPDQLMPLRETLQILLTVATFHVLF